MKIDLNNFTTFQWVLIGCMIIAVIQDNRDALLFSLAGCLIGYLEPRKEDAISGGNE